jgi:hypothetical protein
MKKTAFLLVILMALLTASCVKETYDMDRLSEQVSLSPTWGVSAVQGSVTLEDLIKANDTVMFDELSQLKFFFRKDSVIDLSIDDLIDLSDLFSFTDSYTLGAVKMANSTTSFNLTLNQISSHFTPALRAQFLALDDGSPHPFPAFPSTNTGSHTMPSYANFEFVVFSEGTLTIKLTNNLTAPLSGVKVTLRNSVDNSPIGTEVQVPVIAAGSSSSAFIDLTGKTVYSSIIASVVFDGSPGTSNNVLIKMADKVTIEVSGAGLEVSSGRLVVPEQTLTSDNEFHSFDPGENLEITEFRLNEGSIGYNIVSGVPLKAELTIALPSVTRSGVVFSEAINLNPSSQATGNFPAANMLALLNTNSLQPYNSLPVGYSVKVGSDGNMVTLSETNTIQFTVEMPSPDIDYVKGYFGQRVEAFDPETLDLDIEDLLSRISGEIYVANPSIVVDYSNSFGLPVEIDLSATGERKNQTVDLNLNPFTLAYPAYPAERDKQATFTIDRNNSSLPALISLPPSIITFSGDATLNPQGNTGERNNYIFGDSRFIAAIEASVPADIRIRGLQFSDTLENFLKPGDGDDGFNPSDLDYVRLDLTVDNGFPLSLSAKLVLYDSIARQNLYVLDIPGIIEGAPVNTEGVVTGTTSKTSQIVIDKSFLEASQEADNMILEFTLNTSGTSNQSVKIYSDYSISFRAGVVIKTDLILN